MNHHPRARPGDLSGPCPRRPPRLPAALYAPLGLALAVQFAAAAQGASVSFDDAPEGVPPPGWEATQTGPGAARWTVRADATAPSRPHTLEQSGQAAFPVCTRLGTELRDGFVQVRFRAMSGETDRAAGVVWRYRDPNNYYVCRANALENNVVLYKVEGGRRTDLPVKGEGRTYGKKVAVPSGAWNILAVTVKGSLFAVTLNGTKLYEVDDATFTEPGRVGVWTKADSVTHFDDLKLTIVK